MPGALGQGAAIGVADMGLVPFCSVAFEARRFGLEAVCEKAATTSGMVTSGPRIRMIVRLDLAALELSAPVFRLCCKNREA